MSMASLLTLMRRHAVVGFFLIAYAVSWAVWVPMAIAGARVRQGSAWPNHIPGLFGPMVAAFAMSAAVEGRASVRDLLRRMFRNQARRRVDLRSRRDAVAGAGFDAAAAALAVFRSQDRS